jgi:copper homeostasis protein
MDKRWILEIATSDFETTKSAVEGGADRIELCANLAEGGTTPSKGTIIKCRKNFSVELYPIIRHRGGDFLYSDEEFEIMMDDAKLCRDTGCDGVVIGFLRSDGNIDLERTAKMIETVYPLGVTFHRAFDRCLDPFKAMEELISVGCERILTSGQKPGAPEGVDVIAEINKAADNRIIIMPGSGVREDNIRMLAERTGCVEFHSSLRDKKKSGMDFIHPAFADSKESYFNNCIEVEDVKKLKETLLVVG